MYFHEGFTNTLRLPPTPLIVAGNSTTSNCHAGYFEYITLFILRAMLPGAHHCARSSGGNTEVLRKLKPIVKIKVWIPSFKVSHVYQVGKRPAELWSNSLQSLLFSSNTTTHKNTKHWFNNQLLEIINICQSLTSFQHVNISKIITWTPPTQVEITQRRLAFWTCFHCQGDLKQFFCYHLRIWKK